jgi:MSHA pilin protein MshA
MVRRLDVALLIACLGAGAVVAVPRHSRYATEARVAEVNALSRASASAVQLAHTRWLAAGQPATIDGARGLVAMTQGYPSTATLPLMLAAAETAAFSYEDGVWRHRGPRTATLPRSGIAQRCGVHYQPPAVAGQDPALAADTSGC